ncbi:TAP-like protein-domain-containing protein [Mycena sanguinolenta]|nr:TAP-like protein-domain-containing protein [Mycena sanguinolenta]
MYHLSPSALVSLCVLTANVTQAQDTFNWNRVPLDYKNPNTSSAAITLVRLPAGVPTSYSDYRGPILFNPGGLGASGVNFVLGLAEEVRAVVGPQLDLVGFDPRGIARSVPTASFFATDAERVQFPVAGSLNVLQDAYGRTYAVAMLQSRLAAARNDGSLRFINTESTARDMLTIVCAHGQEKLQYARFSYGTVLGATFAAMFPIKCMLLDGVSDAEDYYSGMIPSFNFIKTWAAFLQGCVSTGPHRCVLYEPTASAIDAKMNHLQTMRTRPTTAVPDLSALAPSYAVVDYSFLRRTLFGSLYTPYGAGSFQDLAAALHALSLGNATALYQLAIGGAGTPSSFFQCPTNASADVFQFLGELDGPVAVVCNDGKSVDVEGLTGWVACEGWPEYLKNNFTISFKTNTSFPILLISNTADPVTPLVDAEKMSAGFDGSVLLLQDGPGHTSLTAPSLCTYSHIAAYFVNGTLPASGTICPHCVLTQSRRTPVYIHLRLTTFPYICVKSVYVPLPPKVDGPFGYVRLHAHQ